MQIADKKLTAKTYSGLRIIAKGILEYAKEEGHYVIFHRPSSLEIYTLDVMLLKKRSWILKVRCYQRMRYLY